MGTILSGSMKVGQIPQNSGENKEAASVQNGVKKIGNHEEGSSISK